MFFNSNFLRREEERVKRVNEEMQDKEPLDMEKGDLLAMVLACMITILPVLLFLAGLIVLALWIL